MLFKINILLLCFSLSSCAIYTGGIDRENEVKNKIKISTIKILNEGENFDMEFPSWEQKIDEEYLSNDIEFDKSSEIEVTVKRKQIGGAGEDPLYYLWGGISFGSFFIIPYRSSKVAYTIECSKLGRKATSTFEYSQWISLFLLYKVFSFSPKKLLSQKIRAEIEHCSNDILKVF